jgi:hypothetical protein
VHVIIAIIIPPIVSVWDPKMHYKTDCLEFVPWGPEDGLKRVETCCPKVVFDVINCCVLTDILYYVLDKHIGMTNVKQNR